MEKVYQSNYLNVLFPNALFHISLIIFRVTGYTGFKGQILKKKYRLLLQYTFLKFFFEQPQLKIVSTFSFASLKYITSPLKKGIPCDLKNFEYKTRFRIIQGWNKTQTPCFGVFLKKRVLQLHSSKVSKKQHKKPVNETAITGNRPFVLCY